MQSLTLEAQWIKLNGSVDATNMSRLAGDTSLRGTKKKIK